MGTLLFNQLSLWTEIGIVELENTNQQK